MKEREVVLFAEDFIFLEAPRWHQGRLWVSDVFDGKVYTLEPDGKRSVVCTLPHRPSGLGFLPDGTPIIVSMRDRKLLRIHADGLVVHADLSRHATGDVNDFVVDDQGAIYVGNFGYDFHGGAPKALTNLHRVEPDGKISVAATDLEFPNGTVLLAGGRTLVVAETWACRLTAFDRDELGRLSNRRVFADLGSREPDGLCVDAEDAVWVCCFNTGEVLRITQDGRTTDCIKVANHAVSCQLGGEKGSTLYCCAHTGTVQDMEACRRLAAVFTFEVDCPAATSAVR